MPYIKPEQRNKWDTWLYSAPLFNLPGELSYVLTRITRSYLLGEKRSYIAYAMITGVLFLTLMEFVRRMVNPYEDQKLKDNSDVY